MLCTLVALGAIISLVSGCGAGDVRALQQIERQIKHGMTTAEVAGILGTSGYLRKAEARNACAAGHVWSSTGNTTSAMCPVCGKQGSPKGDDWHYFLRKPSRIGAPYLFIGFDTGGKVNYVELADI